MLQRKKSIFFHISYTGACNETEYIFFSILLSAIFCFSSLDAWQQQNLFSLPALMEVIGSLPSLLSALLEQYCTLAEGKTSC